MESIASGQGAAYKMFDTIYRYPEIDCSSDEGEKPDTVLGNIELSDISFRYPSRPKVPIFKRINLSIKAGQKVALVGPSGAGKSSIVALLERFYDPLKGKVLLDGRDLKSLNVKWLRQQVC
jgi:ATP-binding cassette subfamily B (MDR/TAP) protein 1